jgi:hypothetical protein
LSKNNEKEDEKIKEEQEKKLKEQKINDKIKKMGIIDSIFANMEEKAKP